MLSTPTDLTYGVLGGGNPGTETSSVACRNAHSEEGLILSATFCPWTIPRYSGCRAPETRDVPMWVESHWNRELKEEEGNYGLCVKDILWLKPLDKQLAAPLETFLSLARPSPPPSSTPKPGIVPPESWPASESPNGSLPAKPPMCTRGFPNGLINCYKELLDSSG